MTILFFYSAIGGKIDLTDDGLKDEHHAFEDLGLALGLAYKSLQVELGPVTRFSTQYRPMDEALVRVSLDLSGRCGYYPSGQETRLSDIQSETIQEFYKALCRSFNCTLHIDILKGENRHHIHEATFKALGAAIKETLTPSKTLISTKGVIDL
jgi:imidazoleglycerol-phosphate dehydratase